MKKIILFLSIVFVVNAIYAQNHDADSVKKSKLRHELGFAVGTTTGMGFSYRCLIKNFGIQINCVPLVMRDGRDVTVSNGLTLFYKISSASSKTFELNLYFANSAIYRNYETNYYYQEVRETTKWNSGLGVDFKLFASPNLSFDLMIGYGQYDNFNSMLPAAEAAMFFILNRNKHHH
ncbi:MAG: hypothetical protein A2W91_00935 [Bacteroidetes bacterium GWF2_38_335]|nr:MAG: hypothetical protein A2W91_00935 [Bacteroidetes bacterium GWF2_38_335]OFY80319.1 MAG: hypothetical protein A2281_17445 [Bacteroidetes bacterium RIFOXYA12_FULL_38_20]HBS88881.1 hypothetical protein [Bacteroidales bacterium]